MSTLSQSNLTPQWKEEVNRRLAAHKSRKSSTSHEAPRTAQSSATSRAAEAAARVAARYSKAPTYSQMQAEEARVAVRAAEIATKVALEAQAVAETALAGLHAATVEPMRGPAVVETMPLPQRQRETQPVQHQVAALPAVEARQELSAPIQSAAPVEPALIEPAPLRAPEPHYELPFAVRWDPDLPTRSTDRMPSRPRVQEEFELSVEDWWSPGENSLRNEPIEVVEGEPTHANLIQFPREVIATRKMRPRVADSYPDAVAQADPQLSIFEVDPRVVSTVAEPQVATLALAAAAPAWTGPEWSGIQLGAQPASVSKTAPPCEEKSTHLAPLGVRMMATVVDCTLIVACFVCVGFVAAAKLPHVPVGKPAELVGAFALVAVGLLYYAAFFNLGVSTPGMKYAGVGLCTFDDQSPTRAQLRRRLVAMFLSLLPVGLGVAWAIFDEDHMSWHDRYSRTYLRKC